MNKVCVCLYFWNCVQILPFFARIKMSSSYFSLRKHLTLWKKLFMSCLMEHNFFRNYWHQMWLTIFGEKKTKLEMLVTLKTRVVHGILVTWKANKIKWFTFACRKIQLLSAFLSINWYVHNYYFYWKIICLMYVLLFFLSFYVVCSTYLFILIFL